MRNLDERMEDIRTLVSEALKNCKRTMTIIKIILNSGTFDKALYGEAKSIEENMNHAELKIDEEVIKTIARFQPMAINLRFLIGVIKIGNATERINDLSLNILKVLKHSNNIKAYEKQNLIEMHTKVEQMFDLFLKCYYEEELNYAYLILSLDDEVNGFKTAVIEATKAILVDKSVERDTDYLGALFISQHLERIGDTIKNLAEIVIYVYNGVDIRHIDYDEEKITVKRKK
ncbi:MAG: hypothetical protein KBF12_00605 [Sebaldella sp.]|nr:hypothetical protein [Sebaldella sp.]